MLSDEEFTNALDPTLNTQLSINWYRPRPDAQAVPCIVLSKVGNHGLKIKYLGSGARGGRTVTVPINSVTSLAPKKSETSKPKPPDDPLLDFNF